MTTIAFKNGMLAADGLVTDRGTIVGTHKKIQHFGNTYYALAGRLYVQHKFDQFIRDGIIDHDFFKLPDSTFDALVIDAGTKEIHRYTTGMCKETYDAAFYALGSGTELALGAMAAGATAYEAVKIACTLDTSTGGEVQVEQLWG